MAETGSNTREPDWRTYLFRALARRCPQCGRGPLFVRFARLGHSCSDCGLVFRREQGAQTGSMYLTAAVNQLFAVLVLACLWFLTDWSVGKAIAIGGPIVLAFCVFFLPYSMSIWVAIEYWTDEKNSEAWVRRPR